MVRRCQIFQKSFKYWHAAKNHALAMAVTIAFDMCKECLTEKKAQEVFGITADEAQRIERTVLNFHDEFRYKLSIQGTTYSPQNLFYPGN
jgi:hypothetical protein